MAANEVPLAVRWTSPHNIVYHARAVLTPRLRDLIDLRRIRQSTPQSKGDPFAARDPTKAWRHVRIDADGDTQVEAQASERAAPLSQTGIYRPVR
jgi:hypothetical protein